VTRLRKRTPPHVFANCSCHPFAGFLQIRRSNLKISHGVLFLIFSLCLTSCHAQKQSSSEFYEGLKKNHADEKIEAAGLFEKALDSPNIHIAAAAAVELMNLHYSGTGIKAALLGKIREKVPAMTASKASGSWAMALDALGTGPVGIRPDREKILTLALNNENHSPDDAVQYLLLELRAANSAAVDSDGIGIFSNAENAAIAGRIAVSRSRYREALVFFRMVMADAPDLFFKYPELLSDLGRSFQYTASGREGIDLFLQWDKAFNERKFDGNADQESIIRFRLLFFAARIARQRGLPESVELFEKALPWALAMPPQTRSGQTDACIWYILNTSLSRDSGRIIRQLESYVPHWSDDGYYSDVMDKLARELLLKRRWTDIIDIFALVKNRPGVIGAKFAWIIGRAVQEDLLSQREMERARAALSGFALGTVVAAADAADASSVGDASGGEQDIADAYIRIAYNNAPLGGASALGAQTYYRSLSAAALGEPFLALATSAAKGTQDEVKTKPQKDEESDTIQFLLGFFRNGASKFAVPYIRAMESGLSPEELRRIAEALGNEGMYQESMRLVTLYAARASYQLERRDLELLYPRPFIDQVNHYAKETGIDPARLFGLIRTESAFNPDAISRSGAIGLTQLMPSTAEETAARILRRGGPDYTRKFDKEAVDEISGDADNISAGSGASGGAADGVFVDSGSGGLIAGEVGVDLLDPGANIHMGAAYLAYLEERMGDHLLALLAYNGGMNRVRRWRRFAPAKFPPDLFLETVEYAETMEYGRAVMGAAAMYGVLY
jgi:soluble lytic murein transglycosylase